MPTITSILDHKFRQAIQAAFGIDTDPIVTPAQNEKFGDYQANAAMSLAKTVSEKTGQKTNPRQIAEQIKANLDLGELATEVGPSADSTCPWLGHAAGLRARTKSAALGYR